MITKQDILDRAGEWQLRPEVVEKDYVLGWLLSGLGRHPTVSAAWVFRGGTCLKKCYFETYRFSEDLDFTLRPEAAYSAEEILEILREISRGVTSDSGIMIPEETIRVDEKHDKLGRPTFKARVGYRGPLDFPGEPRRILFDLTAHEPVLSDALTVPIFHPYPDELPSPAGVVAYSIEELLAEKTRALFERTRPRDLYDVVYLVNNQSSEIDLVRTREIFLGKCSAKSLSSPTTAELIAHIRATDELRSEWENMLRHQLPQLPPIDSLLSALETVLSWIDAVPAPAPILAAASRDATEEAIAPAGIHYWGRGPGLEAIRFAGANRLLVRFNYHGRERLVEPYSLRRAGTGNLLLYAWEVGSTHIKAFNSAEIRNIRSTDKPFVPRYRIEFAPSGFAPILPSAVPLRHLSPSWPVRSVPPRRSGLGPTYVFKCAVCGKEFRRKKNDASLRRHKAPGGWNCSGTRGYLVRTT